MLGNWSFGDYFKKDAIKWAWELLTEIYGLDRDRIYVTVFEGDLKDGLAHDNDSENFWLQFIGSNRIINGNKKDNFWEMGDVGPCGPCSEIHYDLRNDSERKKVDGAALVNKDHPQVIELWNLVFIEFQRLSNGVLKSLSDKHVDTGMGLERLVRAINLKKSNYDTDLFTPYIKKLSKISSKKYGFVEDIDVAFRVIADHIRAVSIAIGDGQIPSNIGAGYVIRRILRRAVRYGYSNLDFRDPFLFDLIPIVSSSLSQTFPELKNQTSLISEVVRKEEVSFLKTLEKGLRRLDEAMLESKNNTVSGTRAFELYDTYGFPLDLTKLICLEKRFNIDEDQFHLEMENQKNRSRSASIKEIGEWVEVAKGESDRFIGYETYEIKSKLIRYRRVKEKKNSRIEVVIDPTPFYPEGGGQVGDVGKIQFGDELINVVKTFKENGLIVHNLSMEPKFWTKEIIAKIDIENRNRTSQNHSSTHLIHFALRKILGSHVEQRGSLVHSGGFRFDFSHFEKISNSDLQKIENLVRSNIYMGIETKIHQQIPIESAKEMGAMALFGEKYGDVVRVVQFDESIELCGGTHVQNTSEISTFLIKSESGIASGIRRIEALSGESAIEYLLEKSNKLDRILNEVSQGDPIIKIKSLKEEVLQLEKKLTILNRKEVSNLKQEFLSAAKQYGNIRVITKIVDLESAYIKDLVFQLKENNSSIVILLISVKNDKVQMHLGVSDDSISIIDAGKWVKELSNYIKGGGGGQPSYASSGGKDPEGVNDLLDKFYKKIEKCAS